MESLFLYNCFFVIYLITRSIYPLSDDWYYLTAPNPNFRLDDLLPNATFWRPLDALFGAFVGNFPALFPNLNRIFVISAHIINSMLLNGIAKEIGVKKEWRNFAICFFLFSSSSWAVTVSPDALNQAYSILFGMLALYVYLKKGGYSFLSLCFLSLLAKESGISCFFVIPLFNALTNAKTFKDFVNNKKLLKQCIKQVVFSFLVIVLYFIIRFALYGGIVLGANSGNYKISFLSLSTLKNILLLFASASTGIDTIALMSTNKSLLLVAITSIFSIVFIMMWIFGVISLFKSRKQVFPLVCLILCAFGLSLPLTLLGRVGEMHAYPILFFMSIIYAFVMGHANIDIKKMLCPIICLFIAFGISSVHKITTIYEYSDKTQNLTQSLKNVYDDPDGSNLFIVINNREGYSVFEQSAATGTEYGLSMRPYFNWKNLIHTNYMAKSEEDAETYIKRNQGLYNHVFVIKDETVKKIK
ncbi:MAG: hypothetical protein SPL89_07200 [Clostridia bacterium]|nr:hypothetical protein [Clostridia bacterium]